MIDRCNSYNNLDNVRCDLQKGHSGTRHECYVFAGRKLMTWEEEKMEQEKISEEAKRDSVNYRYDILDPDFLEVMSLIAGYGAKKYGELNWQKSRLVGEKGPVNHMYEHLNCYQKKVAYDHPSIGVKREIHLAAIAFNAMMEFYWASKEDYEKRSG